MDKRHKRGRKRRLQRRRERWRSTQKSIPEHLPTEENVRYKDFERTLSEFLIAQTEYTEQLAKTRAPVIATALIMAIQVTTFGIARLDSTPLEQLEIWPKSGGSRVSGYTWGQQA